MLPSLIAEAGNAPTDEQAQAALSLYRHYSQLADQGLFTDLDANSFGRVITDERILDRPLLDIVAFNLFANDLPEDVASYLEENPGMTIRQYREFTEGVMMNRLPRLGVFAETDSSADTGQVFTAQGIVRPQEYTLAYLYEISQDPDYSGPPIPTQINSIIARNFKPTYFPKVGYDPRNSDIRGFGDISPEFIQGERIRNMGPKRYSEFMAVINELPQIYDVTNMAGDDEVIFITEATKNNDGYGGLSAMEMIYFYVLTGIRTQTELMAIIDKFGTDGLFEKVNSIRTNDPYRSDGSAVHADKFIEFINNQIDSWQI